MVTHKLDVVFQQGYNLLFCNNWVTNCKSALLCSIWADIKDLIPNNTIQGIVIAAMVTILYNNTLHNCHYFPSHPQISLSLKTLALCQPQTSFYPQQRNTEKSERVSCDLRCAALHRLEKGTAVLRTYVHSTQLSTGVNIGGKMFLFDWFWAKLCKDNYT